MAKLKSEGNEIYSFHSEAKANHMSKTKVNVAKKYIFPTSMREKK